MTDREVPNESLRLHAAAQDGIATLALEGELDLASVPALERAVDGALDSADRATTLELHLAGVTFMDSTGLRALIALRQRADTSGRRLRLVEVAPAVRRVLEMTHTARLFELDRAGG